MIKDCDSDTGEDSEAAGEFLIQKLSAVFVTKNLLELGGDERDNLNFMNFKIRKNSWL